MTASTLTPAELEDERDALIVRLEEIEASLAQTGGHWLEPRPAERFGAYLAPGRCSCCGQAVNHYWTPERMVSALVAWIAERGTPPQSEEWRRGRPTHPSYSHVIKVFGKWSSLFRAAGLTPRKCGTQPWRKEDIAEAMLDHLLRTGRWPTPSDWNCPQGAFSRPHYRTVVAHFGSWAAAKRFAGWTGDTPEPPEPQQQTGCSECGTDLDNLTSGCTTCTERAQGRRRRAREREAVAANTVTE